MSSDMKLIMESFRDFFAREQEIENPENPVPDGEISTVGELKKVIANARAVEAGKEVAKQGFEAGVALVPGLSNVYAVLKAATDAKSAIATLYGTDQEFQGQPALDKMKIDTNVSKIVDNKIENAFISDLLKQLDGMDDNDPLPDLNVMMQQFLAGQFDGNMVKR